MSDDPTKYLIDISKQLGALDSALDGTRQTLIEFKDEYARGKEAAKAFQQEVRDMEDQYMKKIDHKPLITINSILTSWQGIMIILAIAAAVGLVTYGDKAKQVLELKQGVTKGGKR